MWILGPTAGGQSRQKSDKIQSCPEPESGQDCQDVKKMLYPGITVVAEQDILGKKISRPGPV